jgi:hypothetical protein
VTRPLIRKGIPNAAPVPGELIRIRNTDKRKSFFPLRAVHSSSSLEENRSDSLSRRPPARQHSTIALDEITFSRGRLPPSYTSSRAAEPSPPPPPPEASGARLGSSRNFAVGKKLSKFKLISLNDFFVHGYTADLEVYFTPVKNSSCERETSENLYSHEKFR